MIANKISFAVLIVVLFIIVVWFFNCDCLTVIFIGQNFDDVIWKLFCGAMNCPVAIPTVVSNVLEIDYCNIVSSFQMEN